MMGKHLGKCSHGRPKGRWEVDETGSYSCPVSRFRNEELDILRCYAISTVNNYQYFYVQCHLDVQAV
jgi:hypothetical protein